MGLTTVRMRLRAVLLRREGAQALLREPAPDQTRLARPLAERAGRVSINGYLACPSGALAGRVRDQRVVRPWD